MAMTMAAVWHGTEEELAFLKLAVDNNCGCDPEHQVVCAPHGMMEDQRIMDKLVFGLRIAKALLMEELSEGDLGPSA